MIFNDFLKHFKVKISNGVTASVYCPAHEDKNASLSISAKEDRTLLYCHAGCKVSDILGKVGLSTKDTYHNNNHSNDIAKHNKPQEVYYDYTDASGNVIHSTVKSYEWNADTYKWQKKYRQFQTKNGRKVFNLNGIETVIYKLQEVSKAIDNNETIYIVEGEKDVETLRKNGFAATCNPGGANNWKPHLNKYLKDADIVLIPDNDWAGRNHIKNVYNNLNKITNSIQVLLLPNISHKEDITDWFEKKKKSREDFLSLLSNDEVLLSWKKYLQSDQSDPAIEPKFWYFYTYNNKIYPGIDIRKLYEYVKELGFKKIAINPKNLNDFIFVRVIDNIVEIVSAQRMQEIIRDNIDKINLDERVKKYYYSKANNYINDKQANTFLDTEVLNFVKDTYNQSFRFFKNYFVVVTASGISSREYSELPKYGYLLKTKIINREYKQLKNTDYENGMFAKFVRNLCSTRELVETPDKPQDYLNDISGKYIITVDDDRHYALKCVLGYMQHRYNDRAYQKAIILTEAVVTNEPKGGTGKNLLMSQALNKVVNVVQEKGSEIVKNGNFIFQKLHIDTDIYLIDEAPKNFKLDSLFSEITDGIYIEKKYQNPIYIPPEDAPKIVINSNYGIQGNSSSNLRRRYDMELLPYYSDNYTPYEDFGNRRLFDGWNDEEWQIFDIFMLYCLQLFLKEFNTKHELPKYFSETHEKKKLLSACPETFIDYMKTIDISKPGVLKILVENYIKDYDPDAQSKHVRKWLDSYCQIHNYDLKKSTMRNKDEGNSVYMYNITPKL
jgi:5S rRNA maturation endonuclease (ribonuclease M5)